MTEKESLSDIINKEFRDNPAQMEAVKWLGSVSRSKDDSGRSDLDFKSVLTDSDVKKCLCLDVWSDAFSKQDISSELLIKNVTDIFKRMRISVGGRGRADAVRIFNTEESEESKNRKWFSNIFTGTRK